MRASFSSFSNEMTKISAEVSGLAKPKRKGLSTGEAIAGGVGAALGTSMGSRVSRQVASLPLAKAIVPRLSFWFDPASPIPWLAHRMPLYTNGPEVLVVRQGIPTTIFIE